MIAIPNMEKPEFCDNCPLWNEDRLVCGYTAKVSRMFECPLIDIVTCGECKYRNNKNRHCDGGGADANIIVSDDHFCSYGER